MANLIETAAVIALEAHAGQKRKDGDAPYAAHVIAVALKLAHYGYSDALVAAALVHDVLEDTTYPESKLRSLMGDEIMEILFAVRNDDTLEWEEKKKKYIESVRAGSDDVKALATADKICNLESLIAAHQRVGPEIWLKFNRNKEKKIWFEDEMLKMLKETWQHPLVHEYDSLLADAKLLA